MLSFGYALLVDEAIAVLGVAGLDPAVGFLHQARWGRLGLALDLMEEFRPVVVDAVVLRCLSTGIVRHKESGTGPGRGCRVNPRARQVFLAACERRMLTLFTHEPSGRRVSYRVGLGLAGQGAGTDDPGPRSSLPPRPLEVTSLCSGPGKRDALPDCLRHR
jgi:CRISP-associated protein Cas1